MTPLERAREALADSRQCTAGPDDSHDGPCRKDGPPGRVAGVHLEVALAEADRLASENERLRGLLAQAQTCIGDYVAEYQDKADIDLLTAIDAELGGTDAE